MGYINFFSEILWNKQERDESLILSYLFDADTLEDDGSRVLVMLALILLLLVDHVPLKDLEALA